MASSSVLRRSLLARLRSRSLWVLPLDCGGCGGCRLEFGAMFAPRYDAEHRGLRVVSSPKHADIVVVTGPLTEAMIRPLRDTLEQVPGPRLVVALGTCAASGAPFQESSSVVVPVAEVVPVDLCVAGCPPSPRAILESLLKAAPLLERMPILG